MSNITSHPPVASDLTKSRSSTAPVDTCYRTIPCETSATAGFCFFFPPKLSWVLFSLLSDHSSSFAIPCCLGDLPAITCGSPALLAPAEGGGKEKMLCSVADPTVCARYAGCSLSFSPSNFFYPADGAVDAGRLLPSECKQAALVMNMRFVLYDMLGAVYRAGWAPGLSLTGVHERSADHSGSLYRLMSSQQKRASSLEECILLKS